MDFNKIILCTEAPKNTGLAYYYYLAFRDILSAERVALIDEGDRAYDASVLARARRKFNYLSGRSSGEKLGQILAQCEPGTKNVVILFNTSNIREEEIIKLSGNKDVFLIHLLSDNPYGMYPSRKELTLRSLPLFDIVCIFARALMPVLYQLGSRRVERLPFGYCRYTHLVSDKPSSAEYPESIYYFGTWTPTIEEWLRELKKFDLHIEGSFWKSALDKDLRQIGTRPNPHTDKNMAVMARKAGVVVNFTRASHGCFHTMKTFELTAAGGCVISNYSDEQAEFFRPGQGMVYFNTKEEMAQSAGSLMADREKNNFIRTHALGEALEHSYHERARQVIGMIDNPSSGFRQKGI